MSLAIRVKENIFEEKSKQILDSYSTIKFYMPRGSNVSPLGVAQLTVYSEKYSLPEDIVTQEFLKIRRYSGIKQGVNDITNANLVMVSMSNYQKGLKDIIEEFSGLQTEVGKFSDDRLMTKAEQRYLASNIMLYGLDTNEVNERYTDLKEKFNENLITKNSDITSIFTIANIKNKLSVEDMLKTYKTINKKDLSEKIDPASKARLAVIINSKNISNNFLSKAYREMKKASLIRGDKTPKNARSVLVESLFY